MLLSIIGFVIILGPLVVVHEFGHFSFARLFNVKAEIFSIGFGPRIWSRKKGETEVRVSAIPLGGYVKLLGEDQSQDLPPEEQMRALHKQKAWKRFFIFFGGPLFNFLFAILLFMAILLIGEQLPASVIGRIVHGSAAEKAGFQSGDRVTAVNGQPVHLFDDVLAPIFDSPNKPIHFQVFHPGQNQVSQIEIVPTIQEGFSVYGESTNVGEIEGLLPAARGNTLGISDPNSLAAKAGIHTGDQIVELNGEAILSWEDIERAYAQAALGANLKMTIKPAKGEQNTAFSFPKTSQPGMVSEQMAADSGIYSSELFVDKTVAKSPAEVIGVKSGDRLLAVGKQEVHSFFDLRDAVQRAGEKDGKVELAWDRGGKRITAIITPTATSTRDALMKKSIQYTVGVVPNLSLVEPEKVTERILNPFKLLYKGTERMVIFSWRNLVSIQKMFTGDVSVKSLGGPIMIGKIAGESLSHGLISFLTTMAVLSIGLGVLNVLPVPVLDGGHLLLLGIESIRGRPLTMRQMEIIQGVGLSLILLLMAVVMKNDIMRLPFFD